MSLMAIVEYISCLFVSEKYIFLFICIFQWDLICDKSILGSVSSSVIFAGWLLGVVILGWVSDKFGRREVMYFSTALAAVFGFASGFSPLFWLFVAARFVVGFLLGKSKFLKFRLYFSDLLLATISWFSFIISLVSFINQDWCRAFPQVARDFPKVARNFSKSCSKVAAKNPKRCF